MFFNNDVPSSSKTQGGIIIPGCVVIRRAHTQSPSGVRRSTGGRRETSCGATIAMPLIRKPAGCCRTESTGGIPTVVTVVAVLSFARSLTLDTEHSAILQFCEGNLNL